MIAEIDHINIATSDMPTTLNFYTSVLGLRVGPRPEFPVAGYWLYVNDRALVHIQLVDRAVCSSTASALNHVAFRVADLNVAITRLQEHGVGHRISYNPDGSVRQIFLHDPNGAYLELNPLSISPE